MNKEDIIRMAREATVDPLCGGDHRDLIALNLDELERFAALVAAAVAPACGECGKSAAEGWALYCVQCSEDSMVKAAVAAEREVCALVCEQFDAENPYIGQGKACAFEIRERRNG